MPYQEGRETEMTSNGDKFIVGQDLGGTKLLTVLADPAGNILDRDRIDTPAAEGPQTVINAMAASARRVLEKNGVPTEQVIGLGIGAAGPTDPDNGIILASPNMPGWDNVPLRAALSEVLGVEAVLDNDANVAALAEHRWGAGKGSRHMIYITVSTGIGGGLVLHSRLYSGGSGTAGEIGHIPILPNGPQCSCGSHGCLEYLASGTAIARIAREAVSSGEQSSLSATVSDVEEIDAIAVFGAARTGDALATRIIEEGSYYLGLGFTALVNLLNPDMIVVGGGVSKDWDAYIKPAIGVMREHAFQRPAQHVQVVPAGLGGDVGALGAVALALDAFGPEWV